MIFLKSNWIHSLLVVMLVWSALIRPASAQPNLTPPTSLSIEYLGESIVLLNSIEQPHPSSELKTKPDIEAYIQQMQPSIRSIIPRVLEVKKEKELSDWHYYQLLRRVAQQLAPKENNYFRYTVSKYLLLGASGYSPLLALGENKLLLYIQSNDILYNLPIKKAGNRQFVCMNYHDYAYSIDFQGAAFEIIGPPSMSTSLPFNYSIHQVPDFSRKSIQSKTITFRHKGKNENITLAISPESMDYFRNYPVIDYRFQFNIPLSKTTYNSLIPELKERTNKFNTQEGLDYLLAFVRDGFEFGTDTEFFGREKRLSPEETLLSEKSDCEDRSALFFILVKEIYDLPMIVLSYPNHVNIGVQIDHKKAKQYFYQNQRYSIYEPTPQTKKTVKAINRSAAEVVYEYTPKK